MAQFNVQSNSPRWRFGSVRCWFLKRLILFWPTVVQWNGLDWPFFCCLPPKSYSYINWIIGTGSNFVRIFRQSYADLLQQMCFLINRYHLGLKKKIKFPHFFRIINFSDPPASQGISASRDHCLFSFCFQGQQQKLGKTQQSIFEVPILFSWHLVKYDDKIYACLKMHQE